MICEFCGSTLDDNELECPYCGHKTNVEPQVVVYDYEDPTGTNEYISDDINQDYTQYETEQGNSEYTEYTDEPVKTEQVDYDVESTPEKEDYIYEPDEAQDDEPKSSKKGFSVKIPSIKKPDFSGFGSHHATSDSKSIGDLPKLILMGASCLLSLICLISVVSVNNKIESLEQTMLSQFYQLQSANNDISSTLSGLGGQIDTVNTTITEQNDSRYITITRNPTSESTYLGRGSDDDVSQNSPIFYADATGSIQNIEWQVKENDDWVTIQFDTNSNNTDYGLHVYNVIGSTQAESQLCSHNVTEKAFNKSYRCVFSDAYGVKSTDVVTLTQRDK